MFAAAAMPTANGLPGSCSAAKSGWSSAVAAHAVLPTSAVSER